MHGERVKFKKNSGYFLLQVE